MKMTEIAESKSFSGKVRWLQQAIHPDWHEVPGIVVISESVVSISTDLFGVIFLLFYIVFHPKYDK